MATSPVLKTKTQPDGLNVNHLIELLPRKDRLRLLSLCEPFDLNLAEVLCESGMTSPSGMWQSTHPVRTLTGQGLPDTTRGPDACVPVAP